MENCLYSTDIFPCPMLIWSHFGVCLIKKTLKVFPSSNLTGTRYRWVIPYMVLVLVTSRKQALMGRERWTPPGNCFDSLSEQSTANPSSNKLFASLSDNHFEVKNTCRCKWIPAARRLGDLPHCHWSVIPFKVSEFFMLIVEIWDVFW